MKIILAHGILGFGTIDLVNDHLSYFKGVKPALESLGHEVIVPFVNPIGPVAERARALANAIKAFAAPGEEACIIAHSMGGHDARFAISRIDGVASRIRTLVTIGTPHFGSPVADLFSAAHALRSIFGLDARILQELEGITSLHDLTTDAGEAFEAANENRPGIDYRAIAGAGRTVAANRFPAFHTCRPFIGTFALMAARGLANDGMVPVHSAGRHAEPWEIWHIDHADEIGWDLDRPLAGPSPEHLQRYVHIVQRVEQERA